MIYLGNQAVGVAVGTVSGNMVEAIIKKTFAFGHVILEEISNPSPTNGGIYWRGQSGLTGIYSNSVTEIATVGQFQDCTNLEHVVFPYLASSVSNDALRNGKALSIVDLGSASAIGNRNFYQGNNQNVKVILRGNSVTTVSTSCFSGMTGTVYVPSALISSYEADTNWATFVSGNLVTFAALEGSDYESPTWWEGVA